MEKPGSDENSSSRESVVEGSETESDVEEEEFRWRRWLPFLNNDVALTTDIRITEGAPSPEISFIQKFYDHTYSQKEEQINPTPQEAYVSDQSQSLLQGWIKCLSLTEDISKPGFSLNAAVEGQQNNSVDTKLNGFQKDSEEKVYACWTKKLLLKFALLLFLQQKVTAITNSYCNVMDSFEDFCSTSDIN